MNSNPSFEQSQLAKYTPPTSGGSTSAPKFDPSAPMPPLPTAPATSGSAGNIGINEIKSAAGSGINEIKTAQENSDSGKQNPFSSGLDEADGLAKIVTSPLAPVFKPISDAINAIGNKVGSYKSVQDFAQSDAGKMTADVADKINKLANIFGTEAGAEEGISKLNESTPEPTDEEVATNAKQQDNTKFNNRIEEAKKVLNPSGETTKAENISALKNGNVSVKGNGIFAHEQVNPSTTLTHETIADMIDHDIQNGAQSGKSTAEGGPRISSKNWPHQNAEALGTEARVHDTNIDELLGREGMNVPVEKQTVIDKLEEAKQAGIKSRQFVSGSTAAKAYEDVFDIAKDKVMSAPKAVQSTDLGDVTLESEGHTDTRGLRSATKDFNGRAEDLLGSKVYGPSDEGVGNARIQAAKEARQVLNNSVADTAESASSNKGAGGAFKSELQKEAQLLTARDELAKNSGGILGRNIAQKILDENPSAKFTAKFLQRFFLRFGTGEAIQAVKKI